MTAPGGGSAAAVWVSVLPDLSGFGAQLARDVAGVGGNAGDRMGREMGEATESTFSKAAKGIAAAGAVIGAGLGVALVGAMNVEAANDKLSAQLGLTGGEAQRYGKIAGDLYSGAYGDSLETVNEALRQVTLNVGGAATSSDADLQRITAAVLDVSTAFDQDLGGTATAVGQLMKTGLATDATSALDIVTAGFQGGADKAGDFLDTLNEYGVQFQKFGLDGATATGLLSQGLQGGARDADLVADAFKEFSIRAVDGSKLSAEGFSAIGLSASEMSATFAKGGPAAAGALDLVVDRLNSMTDPVARQAAGVALFGTQFEDLGPAFASLDPSAAVASLGQVGGAAAAMGATLNDNATTNLESFKRQVTSAFVDIVGGQILPIVSTFASFLVANFGPALTAAGAIITNQVIPAITSFGRFLEENRVAVTIAAGVIAAVFLPGLVALAVQSTITGVTTAAAWIATQAAAIGAAAVHSAQVVIMVARWVLLGAVSIVQAGITVASWLLSSAAAVASAVVYGVQVGIMVAGWVLLGAQSLLNAARVAAAWLIAMGPIGLVIVAVVGLVALIIANWDTVKTVTQAVFSFIGNFLTTVWNGIVSLFNTSVTFIQNLWNSFWSTVQSVASTVWNAVSSFISSVWSAIQAGFNASVAFLQNLWNTFWNTLRSIADTVFNAIRAAVEFVWNAVRGIFTSYINLLGQAWRIFWDLLSSVASTVWNAIRAAIEVVWDLIKTGFNAAVSFVQGLWQGFWNTLSSVASTVFNAIKGTIDRVIGGIVGAFQYVVRSIGDIWNGIKRLLAVPINFMIGTVYNNGIVKAWNFVAGLLGIGKINPLPLIPEFATGGSIRGPGTGTSDDVLMWGSNGEHMVTAREVAGAGGHAAVEQVRKMWAAGIPVQNLPAYAAGGPIWAQLRDTVTRAVPGSRMSSGYRPGDKGFHGRGAAADFVGNFRAINQWIARNFPNSSELIYTPGINLKNGRPHTYNAAVRADHYDHVHWAMANGLAGGSGDGGGGGFFDFLTDQVRKLYDGATSGIPGMIAGLVGQPPPEFRRIPPAMATTAIKSVGDWLFKKAETEAPASVGAGGGGGVERWRGVVNQALGLTGNPASAANVTLRRMNQESGGNPTVVNRWDSNWKKGTPSVGLMQVIGPTFRANAGQFRNTPPQLYGVSTDPLANIVASMRYAVGRYGSLNAAYSRPGGYDSGGWMQPGFGTYYNGTSKPEAVLTNEQWQTLAASVQGGEGRPTVVFNQEIHNPIAETGSETAVKQHRRASAMGMFG